MDTELKVLSNLIGDRKATQRDIAKSTGMSLGNVNILIKRLVKKGLVQIERLNPRTIRYILTPQGIREKAELTYKYMINSYKFIEEINYKIDVLINSHVCEEADSVILFGKKDEISTMLQSKLSNLNIPYRLFQTDEELEQELRQSGRFLIIAWQPDCVDTICSYGVKFLNLLEKIN